MIKNILYSLFLHCLLAALIYVNFRSNITSEIIEIKDELSISIANLDVNNKSNLSKKTEEPKKDFEKKPEVRKVVKKQKAIAKKSAPQITPEKTNEFKPPEEVKNDEVIQEEVKQEEVVTKEIPTVVESLKEDEMSNLENLNLSAREKFNIQSQLKSCYYRSTVNSNKNKIPLVIRVRILADGTINFDAEKIIDAERYNDPKESDYRMAIDNIVATLEFCSPLRNMPSDKYDIWKEFAIEFGGN